jgi:hypothetical protein
MTILDNGDGYIGYGATDDIGIYQMLFLYKISYNGEIQILKPYYEPNTTFYPGNVGGAMVKTLDNNFALAFNYTDSGNSYGSLMKFNNDLDTIWKKIYAPYYITSTLNCIQTSDSGFMLTGWIYPSEEDYSIPILLKTDSLGNYQWHQIYDGALAKRGQNVIETPDGGYLIGGLRWNPAIYHSLDAMVIKTDSLGNEQWTKFYGNPAVDDDMAHVALADDGNYLVATVYGDEIFSNEVHTARLNILKIDLNGNIITNNKYGQHRINFQIRNFRKENDGFIASGFSKETDSVTFQYMSGWMMKLDNNLDSVWYRDYIHGDENWESYFYDSSPSSDNGYIAIGKARPDVGGGSNKMWILKVDSMGCDTAGCATGVFVEEPFPYIRDRGEAFNLYPNPAMNYIIVELNKTNLNGVNLSLYDNGGKLVKQTVIPARTQDYVIGLKGLKPGIYIIKADMDGKDIGGKKFSIIK